MHQNISKKRHLFVYRYLKLFVPVVLILTQLATKRLARLFTRDLKPALQGNEKMTQYIMSNLQLK